jgi:hypothetical protein
VGVRSPGSSSENPEVAVRKRRVRRIILAVVMVCLLVGADRVGPQVRYYVAAQGLRVGYPAGWRVVVDADVRPPMVMTARPPWSPFGWWADY